MALTPEDTKNIKADLAAGMTPLVITGPDQSVLGALTKAFPESSSINISEYSSVGAFGDRLIHLVMHNRSEEHLIIVEETHRTNPDMTQALRELTSSKKIGGIQLSTSLRILCVARDNQSGLAFNPFGPPLDQRYGLIIHRTKFTPKLGASDITRGLKDLRADLSKALEDAHTSKDTAEVDRLRRMDQCLVLAARGKQDYLPKTDEES